MRFQGTTLYDTTLYYGHDPMCSWCWGFRPVWQQIQQALTGIVAIRYVLGGLAADSDRPMPTDMQASIRDTWRAIQKEIPGTVFNFDFWTKCQPRRSTYPACRAIIAVRLLAPQREADMLLAIQQAYYLQAKNPSDPDVLAEAATQLGLDRQDFIEMMHAEQCHRQLHEEIAFCRKINMNSFPGLVLKQGKSYTLLNIDYTNSNTVINQVVSACATRQG